MIYVYPNGGDPPDTSGKIHSKSEMVVRYRTRLNSANDALQGGKCAFGVTPEECYYPMREHSSPRLPPVRQNTEGGLIV